MEFIRHLRHSRAARIAGLSYVAFAANAICSLISIPLAVTYLDKGQIALWTLVTQVVSYLIWMDLGVGDAVGRKIAEPIACGDQKEINAWWTLSIAVLSSQGFLLLIAASIVWPFWVDWFNIGLALRSDAFWLYAAAAIGAAVSLPIRAYPGILLAQQRFAWVPGSQCVSPVFQLGVFAACLNSGLGVKSYFFAMIAGHLAGWSSLLFAVHTGPVKVQLVRAGFTFSRALELFRYSGSVAIIGLSQTLTRTMPSLLLGRFGGLPLVPVYNFSNRVPEIFGNLTQRTCMAFYPALQAHMVEERRERFIHQFREVQGLTLSLGLAVAAIVIAGNDTIISWLATSSFYVGSLTNLWFAVGALILPYGRTFTNLLQHSGDMGKSALVSVIPVIIGAAIGWPVYQAYHMAGLAAVFALVPSLVMSAYASVRGSQNCGFRIWHLYGRGFIQFTIFVLILLAAGCWCSQDLGSKQAVSLFGRTTVIPSAREWITAGILVPSSLVISFLHLLRLRARPPAESAL